MKIVQINATCGVGSTGNICIEISKLLTAAGTENYIFYSLADSDYSLGIRFSNNTHVQALKSRVFGKFGFCAVNVTRKIIKKLDEIKPDIVHLHNIHSHNVNLELLFEYLKSKKIKTFWTFHDCWAFTGYCVHFDMIGCDKWKTGCYDCVQRGEYSWFFDNSKKLYEKKKELFTGLDLTIITPSEWLSALVKESFLKDYEVKVINNGIDLDVFKPTSSDFKAKHSIQDKHIVLGVAYSWSLKKGIDCFIELSKRLPENYQIVLVGTDERTDKHLTNNILSIHATTSQQELAEIYTAADVFVNTTREDTFPTVNMEALACGTPVVTFNTGGSTEAIDDSCGVIVPKNDIDALEKEILRLCEAKPISKKPCLNKSKSFDKTNCFEKYLEIYGV